MRFSEAPVKEPFSWPNRMLSTRFSGMAPQLTVTKGPDLRPLSPWMARAISSLPTPDSPSISTGMVELAARLPSSSTLVMASLPAIRSAKPSSPLADALMRAISSASASILSAFLMETSSRSGLTGLTTKSTAPARMAVMAASMLPWRSARWPAACFGSERMADSTANAVGAGHDEVEQDKADVARGVGLERGERLVAALGGRDVIAEPLDGLFENTTLGRVVVDDQDALGHDAKLATLR